MFAHYVARARQGRFPFEDEDFCRVVWRGLRRAFPGALAAILMPNHLHLVAPADNEAKLSRVLRATSRQRQEGKGRLWDPVPRASPLPSRDKLRRSVRYLWLNPCRPWSGRRLAEDPMAWTWSTLRDVTGCVVFPWTRAADVSRAFGWPHDAERLYTYAMSADGVAPQRMPVAPSASLLPDRPVDDIFEATLAATRAPAPALKRRGVTRHIAIGLAYRQGWAFPSRLAPKLALGRPNSVTRIAGQVDPRLVRQAALNLHPRLQSSLTPGSRRREATEDTPRGVRG